MEALPVAQRRGGVPIRLIASGSEGGRNHGRPDGLQNVRRPGFLVASTTFQGTGRSESSMG